MTEGLDLSEQNPTPGAAFGSGPGSLQDVRELLRLLTDGSAPRRPGADVLYLSGVATPLGPMLLGTTDSAVCMLDFIDRPIVDTQLRRMAARRDTAFLTGPNDVGQRLEEELEGYFARKLHSFLTPLAPRGTDFQQRVWSALLEIPYGETRAYGQQARMIGAADAIRAVARANGDNRIAIVIPCHRVIGANGTLTGYGGGLWRKRWLLDLEQEVARPDPQTELLLT